MSDDLRRQIEALHEELSEMGSVEPQSRQSLLTLLGDITRLLDGAGLTDDTTPSRSIPTTAPALRTDALAAALNGRLDEMAVQFEAEHPDLGAALRRVVDALGKAGI